ncbi:tail fiber protein [Vibrio phage vB_VpP_BA6]|nr:tail fiber protein [Vibrio phage vB_VpP_BA6]
MATENGFFTNQTQFQDDPNISQRDNLKGFYGTAVRPAYIEDLVAKAEEAAANSKTYSDQSKQYRDETQVLRDETETLFNQTDGIYNLTVGVYNDTVGVYNDTVSARDLALQYRDQALGYANAAAQSATEAATSAANAEQSYQDTAALLPALQAEVDQNTADIALLDSTTVKTSGDQSISGNKIFTTNIITNTIRSTVGGDQGMIMFGGGSTRIGGSGSVAGIQLRPNGLDTGNTDFDYFAVKPTGVLQYEGTDNMSITRANGAQGMFVYADGRTFIAGNNNEVNLRPLGLSNASKGVTVGATGSIVQKHSGSAAYTFQDAVNSGTGSSSYFQWTHADAVRRGFIGFGSSANDNLTWFNDTGSANIVLKDDGNVQLNSGSGDTIILSGTSISDRYEATGAAGGSWGHAISASLTLTGGNSGLAYNVFKMGSDGPKMQALGEGGSTVRLYPGGGNSNFISWQPNTMTYYYTGTSPMTWVMHANADNVDSSIRLRESAGANGVDFGYAGSSANNEFFINTRTNNVDSRAFSLYRDRSRALFNTNAVDVESSGATKMNLYRADGDTNVNIRFTSNLGNDVYAGKTTSNFAIGSAVDLSSAGNQWMIIGSPAATFRVPVVLDGGSPTGSHAIRRDWAEDNLLRRNSGSVTTQDWNTLINSGVYRIGGVTGANRPSAPTVGEGYTYGTLLCMNDSNATNGVKTHLYFPHNTPNADTSPRLPFYRSGYTADYGEWRTLLTLQYADTRYTLVSSDINLKSEVKEVTGALDLVNQIGSYSYIKENAEITQILQEDGGYTGTDEHYRFEMGFIAQEVEKVFPHLVKDDARGYKAIKTGDNTLLAVAYQALRELNAKTTDLEAKNTELESKNTELEARLAAIEAHLGLGE